jgi:hypothetical protein
MTRYERRPGEWPWTSRWPCQGSRCPDLSTDARRPARGPNVRRGAAMGDNGGGMGIQSQAVPGARTRRPGTRPGIVSQCRPCRAEEAEAGVFISGTGEMFEMWSRWPLSARREMREATRWRTAFVPVGQRVLVFPWSGRGTFLDEVGVDARQDIIGRVRRVWHVHSGAGGQSMSRRQRLLGALRIDARGGFRGHPADGCWRSCLLQQDVTPAKPTSTGNLLPISVGSGPKVRRPPPLSAAASSRLCVQSATPVCLQEDVPVSAMAMAIRLTPLLLYRGSLI